MANKYEECVKRHLVGTNKSQIKITFEQILNIVRTAEDVTLSPQVKALYLQTIISTVNEDDKAWAYDRGNVGEKIRATTRMLLDVPKVLADIKNSTNSNYVTGSLFLHYCAKNLDLWCPFEKPPFLHEQGAAPTRGSNVTDIRKSGSDK